MNAIIGEEIGVDIPSLIEALSSKDPTVRERARCELVLRGSTAVIPLIETLKSPETQACWEAAKALGTIRDPAAANALAEALNHDDGSVRWAAARSLIELGSEGLKQTLIALLTNSHYVQMREGASHVVSFFAHRYLGDALLPLLSKFQAYEPAVAIPPAALHVLHELERGDLHVWVGN